QVYSEFLLLPATKWPARSDVTHIRESHYCSKYKQKMNDTGHLGRKLDDSLPDFDGFVVRGCRKCGKREDI
ncbi:hypothetical protein PDL69_30235, partial [Bacillus cereus]|nr:hypothetical protein [Bacillus cereus]